MIKSDEQRGRTLARIAGFRFALAKSEAETSGKRAAVLRGSYEGMIRQLEEEVAEYDKLKTGKLALPAIDRLDRTAPVIVKLRIAKGVSQAELAKRLGVTKQVISRHEEDDYQAVSIVRLQEILDAMGIKAKVKLTV